MTFLLIVINLIFFGLEIWAGSTESIEILYQLGALSPPEVFSGQWWRIITANFLHSGWLHLTTNMLGLYFLGRLVESNLGVWRYLVVYFFSGVGAMFLFAVLAMRSGDTEQILVGASAAIMGLIGVIFAIFLRDWLKENSRLSLRRVKIVLSIVVVQSLFDVTIPDVSLLSHFLGLMLGFTAGITFLILDRK